MDKDLVYARALVAHLKKASETQRGVVSFNHLVQLSYLAGMMLVLPPESLRLGSYTSLHPFAGMNFLVRAQERIDKGIVSEKWDDTLGDLFGIIDVLLERLPS